MRRIEPEVRLQRFRAIVLILLSAAAFPGASAGTTRPDHPVAVGSGAPAAEPPVASDLVLITVASLRADRIGRSGAEPSLAPWLSASLDRSAYYSRAWSPSSSTLPALASVLSGLDPGRHGILGPESPATRMPTLTAALEARGFATIAATSQPGAAAASGLTRGFERVAGEERLPAPLLARRAVEAAATVPRERRLFLWLHFTDASSPYTAPLADLLEAAASRRHELWRIPLRLGVRDDEPDALPPAAVNGGMRQISFYLDSYDAAVRLVDRGIEEAWSGLERLGRASSTAWIVASLHGEALGEHGLWFSHGFTLYREEIEVPLLFRGPGVRARVDDSSRPSLLDLAPTALDLLGVRDAAEKTDGISLAPVLRGDGGLPPDRVHYAAQLTPPWSRAVLHSGRLKLIVTPPRPPDAEGPAAWRASATRLLFDVESDPREALPLQQQRISIANELSLWIEDRYPPLPGTPPAADDSWHR